MVFVYYNSLKSNKLNNNNKLSNKKKYLKEGNI